MILTKYFGVGVSCRNLYSFVVYLYVNGSGSVTSVGEERANLSAVVYLYLCGFCFERFPLPLGAWGGLRYFIVALPEPSINYFSMEMNGNEALRYHELMGLKPSVSCFETLFCDFIVNTCAGKEGINSHRKIFAKPVFGKLA